jgi:hypothetical protein
MKDVNDSSEPSSKISTSSIGRAVQRVDVQKVDPDEDGFSEQV